jgi:hypothetical protein
MLRRQEQHHQKKVTRTASKRQRNPINGEGKYGLIPTKTGTGQVRRGAGREEEGRAQGARQCFEWGLTVSGDYRPDRHFIHALSQPPHTYRRHEQTESKLSGGCSTETEVQAFGLDLRA